MAVNTTLVWSNIVAALGAAIVSTLITAWYFQGFPAAGKEAPGMVSKFLAGPSVLAVETITYIPHILLLFGVLADMFTMQGVYSIPSLVGLISIPLNFIMKFFWDGLLGVFSSIYELYNVKKTSSTSAAVPEVKETVTTTENPMYTTAPLPGKPEPARKQLLTSLNPFRQPSKGGAIENYNGCEVQGFSALASPYAPQTLVVTATVFIYYILDIIANRGWVDASASIVTFGIVYIAQTVVIGDDCDTTMNKWIRSLLAFAEGTLFGGSAYGVVQAYYPTKLPSTALPAFPKKTASDLTRRPDGTYVDENNVPWSVLPSGVAVPDVSTGSGLAAAIGETTGTPAGQTACPTR